VIAPENGLSALAEVLRAGVESGAPELELLRDIIQCSDDFARLSRDDDRRAFIAEPAATGDARYDALLAGLAVHFCREAGLETTPAWTRDEPRYLDRMWWFGLPEGSRLRAYNYQRTPSCMRARGVIFNEDNLKSL
jgi:hypothetical protein